MAESPVCESHVPQEGATIRYRFIAMHRRGLVQSLVSRYPSKADRQGVGMKCQTSPLHSTGKENPSRDFSHTGSGEESAWASSDFFGRRATGKICHKMIKSFYEQSTDLSFPKNVGIF